MQLDPSLLIFGVLIVLMLLVLQRGSRQRRELAQVQQRLAPGVEVMMASGMFGTVTAVEDQVVTIESAPGQASRWDRRAVAKILTPQAAETSTTTTEAPTKTSTDEGGAGSAAAGGPPA